MLIAEKGTDRSITNVVKTDTEVVLFSDSGNTKLKPISSNIIQIVYTLSETFSKEKKLGIVDHNSFSNWSIKEDDKSITLITENITLIVNRKTGTFKYLDKNGFLLTQESKKGGRKLTPYRAYKSVLDENSIIEKIVTPDGIKEVVIDSKKEFYKELNHAKLSFEWIDGEALYGMGQHEEGILNLRGSRKYIHQGNMKIAMPFLMSTNGYGILFDTYSPLIFNDNEYGSYLYSESVNELDFYFIQGESFDNIISGYRKITGQASMLPKWAFGYIQSLERYETQKEILDTAKEYRDREVPLDCIILDWQSWEEGKWGQKSFDATRFPNPKQMTDDLHKNGTNFMISIWPNMNKITENYKEMKENNTLFQNSEIYDAFSQKARDLYWKQTLTGLFSKGIDGWWCDASEPFSPEWNSADKPEPDQNYLAFHDTAKNYIIEENTNAYPLMHSKAMYEGQRNNCDEKRVINLTRSGYTGQQKYGTILWSGDISANWKTLKNQIPEGLNICASGMPYWTLDIGGFFVKQGNMWFWDGDYEDGCNDLGYRELYTRWLQLGTFLPIFRSHGTDTRREIWNFGEKGEPFYDTIHKFINLRYKLLPYIYSMAGMVTLENYTMMRVLPFDFINDKKTYNLKDQYMFGPSFMVCPVTEPMYYAPESKPLTNTLKTREVYLPEGSSWYDFWTNKKFNGGQVITANADLEIMPIFVKEGSIIPMVKSALNCKESSDTEFILNIYTGKDCKFKLYQDENNNYNYENGDYSTIDINWQNSNRKIVLEKREGSFNDMNKELITFKIVVNGIEKGELSYKGEEVSVKL